MQRGALVLAPLGMESEELDEEATASEVAEFALGLPVCCNRFRQVPVTLLVQHCRSSLQCCSLTAVADVVQSLYQAKELQSAEAQRECERKPPVKLKSRLRAVDKRPGGVENVSAVGNLTQRRVQEKKRTISGRYCRENSKPEKQFSSLQAEAQTIEQGVLSVPLSQ